MAKWGVYKYNADGTKKPYDSPLLQEFLSQPNALMTWNQLIQEAIGFKLLTGNTFLWGIKGRTSLTSDKFSSIYVLPSQHVQINMKGNQRGIESYSLDYFGQDGEEDISVEDVLHLKTFNPDYNGNGDFLYGQSPLRAAYNSLQTNNDAILTSRNYLKNQGPRGFLSTKMDDVYGEISESDKEAMRTSFRRNNTGIGKAGQMTILPGDWKYSAIDSTSADLQLIEHYKLTVNDICNVYNFPTVLISDGQTSFSNQKEAKKALWSNVIIPVLTEIRDGLNTWLTPKYGNKICLDFDIKDIKELQEDIEKQANAVMKLQNVVTVNEARALIGLAPIEGPEGEAMYRFVQGVEGDREGGSEDAE